jgi:hypothetical protein
MGGDATLLRQRRLRTGVAGCGLRLLAPPAPKRRHARAPARQVFHALVPPCMLFLCVEFAWGFWLATLAAPHCAAGGALALPALLVAWPHWPVVKAVVEAVYVLLSVLSFVNILYFVMGFEKYGRFVLMLIQVAPPSLCFAYLSHLHQTPARFKLVALSRFAPLLPGLRSHYKFLPPYPLSTSNSTASLSS